MTGAHDINELENFILLGLVRLGDDAYGVTIREEIERRAGRSVSIAAVYAALERLEKRGFVEAWISAPTSVRGGRAKKHFKILAEGAAAARAARRRLDEMWQGLELHPDLKGDRR